MNLLQFCWYMLLEAMGIIMGKLASLSDEPVLVLPYGFPRISAILIILRCMGHPEVYHEHFLLVFSALFAETLIRQAPGLVEIPYCFSGIVLLLYLITGLTYLIRYEPLDLDHY